MSHLGNGALTISHKKIAQLRHLTRLHAHHRWFYLLPALCTSRHAASASSSGPPHGPASPSSASTRAPTATSFTCSVGSGSDASSYLTLMKSASSRVGTQVHAHAVKLGLDRDAYLRNAVMTSYAKAGPVGDARRIFDEMPEKRIPADWNSMISGYWKWGFGERARELFDTMPCRNVITWTAMVAGCAKTGDLDSARKYFDKMPRRNVVSWNAMLSGYAQNGLHDEALKLFDGMASSGFQPDDTTLVAVISSCAARGDASLAASLIERLGFNQGCPGSNFFVKTALLDMYAKCGSIAKARQIFDELRDGRSTVTWNAMISAYCKEGDLVSARELFDTMPLPERDVVSWNTMISGYAQNGQSALAIQLFRQMTASNVGVFLKPNEVTISSVLSACGHLGAMESGNWVVNFVNDNRIELGISGYNSLIFMYSRCGRMDDARRVFYKEMGTKDVVSYNTLITGLAAHGHGWEALQLLSEMKARGFKPNHVTYTGILTACSHAGLLREGREVFESIRDPMVDHYACMVDLLGRVGELERAELLIQKMPMEPHAGVYGSFLNACRIQRRVDLGETAARKLFELEPNHSGNYVLLSNLYASVGRWGDVHRVRELMREKGVKKATAWSCVEHKGRIHEFVMGDRYHERSDEIYEVLGKLETRMRRAGYMVDESCALRDVGEEEKEESVRVHSERLAICYALLVSEVGTVIQVVKNLRVCPDCHAAIKLISKLERRKIIVRDNNRFHHFVEGKCSCNDHW
ncbi:hypothetical protein CRG98_029341 [Punica granatum]|uniref:DYW domain-containing protein n=1 Tax=Punica granatum TaxID=22663 RepID=A0A2I0J202_PUNGR|nr:hypothetical protein CRG98_029341 [Punica granatum]